MKRRKFLELSALMVLAASSLVGCAQSSITLRYRLRIVVSVAGQRREGASVLEVQLSDWGDSSLRSSAGRFDIRCWGEAVVIDLEKRGLLFGLLEPPLGDVGFTTGASLKLLSRLRFGRQPPATGQLLAQLKGPAGELPLDADDLPALLRFRDIKNPRTAESVDRKRLDATFGEGASFVSASIEVTQDPVTRALDKRLPWLSNVTWGLTGQIQHGSSAAVSERLSIQSFKRDGD